ncbi:hypothetical protein [Microtetraspora sp. NBRC 16547]|uniref:hypothetical protein n=1 Tax=Microtetraspora sp. NBRC 16547 TaxID=3030993 RepID=UPI0024A53A7D|nr:hypothetical protein [Microtetraspora sp. NBRC 16547]GLW99109.1 hypothetical protein Misp02_31960 [Microtetraspora sp. NBRC 16547]
MSPEVPALRLPRAIVFAAVCVVVSAAGHAVAGGGSVPPDVMALGAVGTLALAYALNGRERGPEVVLTATIGAQILLHELFAWSATTMLSTPVPSIPMPSTPMPAVRIVPGMAAIPAAPVVLSGAGHGGHLGVGMPLAHLVLAASTGWWLYRGERAVWLMLRLWNTAPFAVLRWIRAVSVGTFSPPGRAVPPSEPGPYVGREVAAAIHRRGPPPRPAPALSR